KKATEVKPDDAAAWGGLANVYNVQRKFDLAQEAGAKASQFAGGAAAAAGGGNADALYNQGGIPWNAGKIADAKKQFQARVRANPNHGESDYQLGMALINEGKLADAKKEFETYVKLDPNGKNVAQVNAMLPSLK